MAIDGVQAANSGHPGMPMGMADIATVLWGRYLVVDPRSPEWADRDRFVLSNGHGSMLLYSLLHLSGFPVSLDDLKEFRQLNSHTPGHPEREPGLGIEVTTGPLGQGFGMGVGLAIAEANLAARFGDRLVDHRTFGFVSDGDLMEGVSSEAASLAGHLELGKLVYYYDDNQISIDGSTDITFTEDVPGRFAAVGWHTLTVDGHDREAIADATDLAFADGRPSLISCKTHIGYGSPNRQDTAKAHGAPLGEDELTATKLNLGLPADKAFYVPDEVREYFSAAMVRGTAAHGRWQDRLSTLDTGEAEQWTNAWTPPPVSLEDQHRGPGSSVATRSAMGAIFDRIAELRPDFIGGAADLVESTKTDISTSGSFTAKNRSGRNIHFGIREHAMGTIVNGMAVHGGLRPYAATFFTFSDYMRPAIRMSALMGAPSIWVFTHDSIFLGEDGPTHQPVEHLASLRAMPGLVVLRPADANETVDAWEFTLNNADRPVVIVCSRQNLPILPPAAPGAVSRGAYVVRDGRDFTLVATGSEVSVALEAAELVADRWNVGVVSMPSMELYLEQPLEYQRQVIPDHVPVVSFEAGATFGWQRITGSDGLNIGVDTFGASAPAAKLAVHFRLDAQSVADRLAAWMETRGAQ